MRFYPACARAGAGPPSHGHLTGERAAKDLERIDRGGLDPYEIAGDLGALGVVVELVDAGLWKPALRASPSGVGFARADEATRAERGFRDTYAARVRLGFELVARA
ncbi:hypothetical protein [Nannocystis punicea]|uniref:Uncharacterized protein n=1 Tax=Nannocystis punicea TaxID=2995304 RepID=A0ABY7HG95_9BACT|nr:hypothetical protein [Nannocystis poenicansa]WAS98133.1 hypothetical protein O0S08_18495 [Nannocystis poenicansa]